MRDGIADYEIEVFEHVCIDREEFAVTFDHDDLKCRVSSTADLRDVAKGIAVVVAKRCRARLARHLRRLRTGVRVLPCLPTTEMPPTANGG